MSLLLGSLTIGVILALLAIGVFISFRIFSFPDMTAEGTVTLGAAVAAAMVVAGYDPLTATVMATVFGGVAGALTGILHTRFDINALLAGILMMTALYSVNLWVMGRSNLPLMGHTTLATWAAQLGEGLGGEGGVLALGGFDIRAEDLTLLLMSLLFVALVCALLFFFFRTQLGTAMRATGDNPQMIRALGVSDGHMVIAGLALSNALIALSGALLAQYQGFADVQMGIGMLVWGLASVIIGEALVGNDRLGYLLIGAVLGSILFRLMVAVALRWGLDPNYLKLITAVFVLFALILPGMLAKLRQRRGVEVGHA
jgi:putative tryptophan/tyrosine transport system permease protein